MICLDATLVALSSSCGLLVRMKPLNQAFAAQLTCTASACLSASDMLVHGCDFDADAQHEYVACWLAAMFT